MASLRELMKLEKRRRSECNQSPISTHITQSTTDDDISQNDENINIKRVTFSDESLITQEEESQIYVEPKLIHEEYYIEDFQNSSPLITDTTNPEEGDFTTTPDLYSNDSTYNFSESALLTKINQDKEKWLKIAGLDSFDYSEVDNQTSLIKNNIITNNNNIDINDAIKMKIDQAISKSNASISNNFESSIPIDKASVANLPVGFFDDRNLDSRARGEATREEAIEQLKNLVKLERMIRSQEQKTPEKRVEDDLELDKLESNNLLKSLIRQKQMHNPMDIDEKKIKRNIPLIPADDDFELDWRSRNV